MTYNEAREYIFQKLPMYQRIGTPAYKSDLTNTIKLCEYLGNPHLAFPTIHVGGTNGKGSVSHMLAAACQAAGLKTGLFISPHYKDLRERMKINGKYIPHARVVRFIDQHRPFIDQVEPSFFELFFAMALDHFRQEKVDIAVIEVGLGGLTDSTNVILPELSVITNISYDHINLLGNTLPQIAAQKAGIIKPGIPVVIGETQPESAPVFLEKAAETGSEIHFADQHFQINEIDTSELDRTTYQVYRDGELYLEELKAQVAGPYQLKNIATVLQAWETFTSRWRPAGNSPRLKAAAERLAQPRETLQTALADLIPLTRFQGRWQVINQSPLVLADSAHNEGGVRMVFERLSQLSFTKLHIVMGYVNDKELGGVLSLFPADAQYYFAKADIPRGLEAELLREQALVYGLKGKAYGSVRQALGAAKRAARPGELVVVMGSVFVVAEVL